MPEPDLAAAARIWLERRDSAAARQVMDGLYPQVIRIVRNHLPFRMDEEDLAQEVFGKLFANLHKYTPIQPLEHWASRLAINVCRDHLRARRRRPELRWSDLSEAGQMAFDAAQGQDEPDSSLATDAKDVLHLLLDTLNPEDRMVITLLHLEEKSIAEISELTGWSKVMVKVRAFRARHKLRAALEALEGQRKK